VVGRHIMGVGLMGVLMVIQIPGRGTAMVTATTGAEAAGAVIKPTVMSRTTIGTIGTTGRWIDALVIPDASFFRAIGCARNVTITILHAERHASDAVTRRPPTAHRVTRIRAALATGPAPIAVR